MDGNNKSLRRFVGLVVVIVIIIGGMWLFKEDKKEEDVAPEIILESSKMMEPEELQLPLSDAEKQKIEDVFLREGVEMTVLRDVSEGQAAGTAWRNYDGQQFSHKLEVTGLESLEKGFYYEGWLVGDEGFFSTGRMAVVEGKGKLYFTSDSDKMEFRGAVVTLEPEDGDTAPAEHILEGSF